MKQLSLISLACLLFLACNKKENFIPVENKSEAYYSDHSPTLVWSVEASVGNDTLPFIAGPPIIVDNMVFVTIQARRELKAFSYETGDLLWTMDLKPYLEYSTPDNYEVTDLNGNLYLIDKETGMTLNFTKEEGQVLSVYHPDEDDLNLRREFPALIDGDHYYKIRYIDPNTSSLVKVNYRDRSYTTIATLDQDIDEPSNALLDLEGPEIYFTAILDRSGKGAFSVHLETGEIKMIWQEDEHYFNSDPIAMIDQTLYFINSYDQVIAIDKHSGNQIWTYENNKLSTLEIIVKDDQLYLIDKNGRMLSLDPTAGSVNWHDYDVDISIFKSYGLYTHKPLLVGGRSDLNIVDLSDGQLLVSKELPDPNNQVVRYLSFDPVQKTVVVASYYHLFKYTDLLP